MCNVEKSLREVARVSSFGHRLIEFQLFEFFHRRCSLICVDVVSDAQTEISFRISPCCIFLDLFFSSPPVDCRVMMEQERLTNNKKEGDRDHYFIFCQCVTECKAELFLCGLEWCLMEASSAFACRGFRSERWSGESFGSWPSRCLAVTLNKKYDDGFISIFQLFSRTALFRAQIPPCCLLHRERALLTMIKCFSFCLLIL